MRALCLVVSLGLIAAAAPAPATADTASYKLLPNYLRATFTSDAPLETFVGNTAADGVQGSVTRIPPARRTPRARCAWTSTP
jgi:hypothetical protein